MPLYLVCDVSNAMRAYLQVVNEVIKRLRLDIAKNPTADDRVRMCIISFSGSAEISAPIGRVGKPVTPLRASGGYDANYGTAFRILAEAVENDIRRLKNNGYGIYRPCALFVVASPPVDHDWLDTFKSTLRFSQSSWEGITDSPLIVSIGIADTPEDVLRQLGSRWYQVKKDTDSIEAAISNIILSEVAIGEFIAQSAPPLLAADITLPAAYNSQWV